MSFTMKYGINLPLKRTNDDSCLKYMPFNKGDEEISCTTCMFYNKTNITCDAKSAVFDKIRPIPIYKDSKPLKWREKEVACHHQYKVLDINYKSKYNGFVRKHLNLTIPVWMMT